MDTSIFLHTMRYKFLIIICLRIFGFVKHGGRNLMGRPRPNFCTKLEPIHMSVTNTVYLGISLMFILKMHKLVGKQMSFTYLTNY